MSAVVPVSTAQRDKRSWPDDPSPPDDTVDSPSKRACSEAAIIEPVCLQTYSLEELYELETSSESCASESTTQENLVSEMMRSLEKVIGGGDDPSSNHVPNSAESSNPLPCFCRVEADESEMSSGPSARSDPPEGCRTEEISGNNDSATEIGRGWFDYVDDDPGVSEYTWVELASPDEPGIESSLITDGVHSFAVSASLMQDACVSPMTRYEFYDYFSQCEESGFDQGRENSAVLDYCL